MSRSWGLHLAASYPLFCTDTNRRIKYSLVVSAKQKTLKAWLSRVTARSLAGENQSLRASGFVSAVTVTCTV